MDITSRLKKALKANPNPGQLMVWSLIVLLLGAGSIILYPDADQLDSSYHFLLARWSWRHPEYLLSVWGRPLFTLIYSIPAQWGYVATKIFTLAISLTTAWQCSRLAERLGLPQSSLALPLLLFTPIFWQLSTGVYTETLFGLFLVVALRLRHEGYDFGAILVISLLILIRPEGLFIGLLWGAWHVGAVLLSGVRGWQLAVRTFEGLFLASGIALWVLGAWLMTGDPLWILHNWPPDWNPGSQANGTGPIWWYTLLLPLIVGPFWLPAFFAGHQKLWRTRSFLLGGAVFWTIFIVHSILYLRGWFGAAGYSRYFVCIAPVTALITLAGWDWPGGIRWQRWRGPCLVAGLLVSIIILDLLPHGRDALAIRDLYQSYVQTPAASSLPVERLITSQGYMRIIFDRDHWEMPGLTANRAENLDLIRQLPPRTLIFWDGQTGPAWYHLTPQDFENAGFKTLVSRQYLLTGRILPITWKGSLGARHQSMHLLYR